MNKKLLFSLFTAGVFALLSSCGDSVVDATNQPDLTVDPETYSVQTRAALRVFVQDANTGKPIAATVTLQATGEAAPADEAGAVVFDSLPASTYIVLVEATDYAPVTEIATIEGAVQEGIYIAQGTSVITRLYPLNAKLSGNLYYTDKNGQNKPAATAKVALIISESTKIADKRTIETVVGADGKYTFTSLPAVSGTLYSLYVLEYKSPEDVVYGVQNICLNNCSALIAGGLTNWTGNSVLSSSSIDEVFIALGYSNLIESTESAKIAFSSPVDLKKINSGSVIIRNTSGATIAAKLAWNTTGDTLTISPYEKWISSLEVSFNSTTFRSVNNKSLTSGAISINVKNDDVLFAVSSSHDAELATNKTPVVIAFSTPVDVTKVSANTVTLNTNDRADYTWNATGDTLTIKPFDKWTSSFSVRFIAEHLKSKSGKSLVGNYSSTSDAYINNTYYSVYSIPIKLKGDDVQFVVRSSHTALIENNEPIKIAFSLPVDPSRINASTVVYSSGSQIADYTWNATNDTLTIKPFDKWTGSFSFYFNTSTLVSLSGKNLYANSLGSNSSNTININLKQDVKFVVSSWDSLLTVKTTPVKIAFTVPVDPIKLRSTSIKVNSSSNGYGTPQGADYIWNATNDTLTVKPFDKWTINAFYVIFENTTVKSVDNQSLSTSYFLVNLKDNGITFDVRSWDTLLTANTTPVKIAFTAPVDKVNLKSTSIKVTQYNSGSGTSQGADYIWNAKNDTLTVKPFDKWTLNTFYVVFDNATVKSVDGQSLSTSYYQVNLKDSGIKFDVRSNSNIKLNNSTDTIVVIFTLPVDPNFRTVTFTSSGSPVPAERIWKNGAAGEGDTLRIVPFNKLSATSTYYVGLSSLRSIDGQSGLNDVTVSLIDRGEFAVRSRADTTIGRTDTVVIAFTRPVDKSLLSYGNVVTSSLNNSVYLSYAQAVDFKWNATGDILKIAPVGEWTADYQFYVYLSNSTTYGIRSDFDNKQLTGTSTITVNLAYPVDISAATVTGLTDSSKTNYSAYSTNIYWNKVEGAEGYRVFRKLEGENTYTQQSVSIYNSSSPNTFYASVSLYGNTYEEIGQKVVSVIVQAYNSKYSTSLINAVPYEITDKVKPTVNGTKYDAYQVVPFGYHNYDGNTHSLYYGSIPSYTYGLNQGYYGTAYGYYSYYTNSYNSGLDSTQLGYFSDLAYYISQPAAYTGTSRGNVGGTGDLIGGCTLLSEPMDTNTAVTPIAATITPAISRVTVFPFWSSSTYTSYPERVLCYVIKVAEDLSAAESAAVINSTISISGLKDKKGNALEIIYGTGASAPKKSTLDFKIKSNGYIAP